MADAPHIQTIEAYSDLALSYIGPPLHDGPLPALFYFALSAHETLAQDPFNQPAVYLSSLPLRIFTIDLPAHGKHLSSRDALNAWETALSQGQDLITACVERVSTILHELIDNQVIIADKLGVMGLSRGAFIATHVAARCAEIKWIVGFAPLTKLSYADALDLENLTSQLIGRNLRMYIGNCDQRVGTRHCFDFIEKLSKESHASGLRSPNVELIIGPSIGFQGHGTSPQVFHHGAQWIAEQLEITDAC